MAPSIPVEFTGQKKSKKYLLSEMVKSRKYSKEHSSGFVPDNQYAVETMGESEGLGSSGHIDAEMTAVEHSSAAPKRKCISINSDGYENFCVPLQVLSLSKMSRVERKDLQLRFKMELEKIQVLQRRVASYNSNTVVPSPSSDIQRSSDGQKRPLLETALRPSEMLVPRRKNGVPPSRNGARVKKSTSGHFESVKPAVGVNTSIAVLMKQCDSLLNRLMSHQYGWVFNTPVDVIKSNIPDYFDIIKHPMDLGTIKSKISAGQYLSPLGFADDVRLTFSNAMTYNPPGNYFYTMADTLRKQFEMKWKAIEKKLPAATDMPSVPSRAEDVHMENETIPGIPPAKKKKVRPSDNEVRAEPVGRIMTHEAKHNLSIELEALLSELPESIINFLKEHGSNECQNGEDEIEIDLDALNDDTLFTLRNLLDDHLLEKRKSEAKVEPRQVELVLESGLGNTLRQPFKEEDDNDPAEEDVDIVGGNDAPISNYPSVEIETDAPVLDSGSSLDSKLDEAKDTIPVLASKEKENLTSGADLGQSKSNAGDAEDGSKPVNGLGEVDLHSQDKPVIAEPYILQEGESALSERRVSPEKLYRAALLRNRFADVILKAQEKALEKGDKQDPEKLQIEREELDRRQKEEKARLQAEARAAEEARRKAEAEAAVEAKRKRELEREAARQALQKMEKTVDINENSQFMEDLEMLRASHGEDLTSFMDEMSPDLSLNDFGSFKLQGSNPLEQLGLYMKDEEEEEEVEPPPILPDPVNDVEDGEID
ncbi:transcription factor GTE8-like isoform X2 [Tripterygium wilfordii]|uniref:transcription factor GTE8-like isoform X2 n=1 Tax=Tripterygium wilfordii TaxID=458696 RepID=UPI0018F85CCE|nr:transcription factor GTE8-like isoform X2 [Tripterygium wilfordii]